MSFSFSKTASTKVDLARAVAKEMEQVVQAQPVHSADSKAIMYAFHDFLALMPNDPTQDVAASVSGSVWVTEKGLQQVSCSINIGMTIKPGVSA